MNAADWFSVVMFAIGLTLLGVLMFRQASSRAQLPPRGRR